jgi:hypothetical protein
LLSTVVPMVSATGVGLFRGAVAVGLGLALGVVESLGLVDALPDALDEADELAVGDIDGQVPSPMVKHTIVLVAGRAD